MNILTDKYKGILNKKMAYYLNSMMKSYNVLSLFEKMFEIFIQK